MSNTNNHGKVYVNSNGDRVMRVTEVIKVLAKDQLILWANMLGFKHIDYKTELNRTANIGSMVHGHIEDFSNPKRLAVIDFDKYDIYSYRDQLEAMNAIKSFDKWYAKNRSKFKIKFTERVIVGENLGGTIDSGWNGIKDPDKVILVDYKTSKAVYFTMFLQLAGYVDIYEEVYGANSVEGVAVMILDKTNGDEAIIRFIPRDKLDPYISCFRCLLSVAQSTKMLQSMFLSDTEKL